MLRTKGLILTALFMLAAFSGCGDIDLSSGDPDIEGQIGDKASPPDEWEIEPIKMAIGSKYLLSFPSDVSIDDVEATVEGATVTPGGRANELVVTSDKEGEGQIILDLSEEGKSYEAITIDLAVLAPDAAVLPGDGEVLFLGDEFHIGYSLESEGVGLVGEGFNPFMTDAQGVSLEAGTYYDLEALYSTHFRALGVTVEEGVDAFELTSSVDEQVHKFARVTDAEGVSLALTNASGTFAGKNDDVEPRVPITDGTVSKDDNFLVIEVALQRGDAAIHGGHLDVISEDERCTASSLRDLTEDNEEEESDAAPEANEHIPAELQIFLDADIANGETVTCVYTISSSELPGASTQLEATFSYE